MDATELYSAWNDMEDELMESYKEFAHASFELFNKQIEKEREFRKNVHHFLQTAKSQNEIMKLRRKTVTRRDENQSRQLSLVAVNRLEQFCHNFSDKMIEKEIQCHNRLKGLNCIFGEMVKFNRMIIKPDTEQVNSAGAATVSILSV